MRSLLRKIAVPFAAQSMFTLGVTSKVVRVPLTHLLYLHHVPDAIWFDQWLSQLKANFELIDHHVAVQRIRHHNHPRPAVSISFDDGFASCWPAAELLEKHGTRGMFYICPNVVGSDQDSTNAFFGFPQPEAVMNWSKIQQLSQRGHAIGSHTCTHPQLSKLDSAAAVSELNLSKQILEDMLQCPCNHFAWPYGRRQFIDDRVIEIAYEAGYDSVASGIRGSHQTAHPGVLLRNVVAEGESVCETLFHLALGIKGLDSHKKPRNWVISQTPLPASRSTGPTNDK